MSIIRDLWNDPDPIKWVIFGGFGVSAVLGGLLYWQAGMRADLQSTISVAESVPRNANDPAKSDSLQEFLQRADQLQNYMKQVEDDPFAKADEDPGQNASQYVTRQCINARIKDPKVIPSTKGSGTGFVDTEISVSFLNGTTVGRENIYKFLYDMELSPLVVTTYFSWIPAERNHRAGQTLPGDGADQWIFESKFTVRRPKLATPVVAK
ncbi:MAG: hypothetical protein HY286_11800 [Planctomycetes bacterium]|nr:hypothetical protein [Planctomycetota bacterium]